MPDELGIDEVLALLDENPGHIVDITNGMSAAELHTKPSDDEWSANDVLAHLRCCADVWGEYMRRIADEDTPTIRAESPRGRIKQTTYPDQPFPESLGAFLAQRRALVEWLRKLPRSAWARTASVKHSGKVKTLSILSYARWIAEHERHHLNQFARIRAER